MATVTTKDISNKPKLSGAPYGNVYREKYRFQTNASGVFADSDQTTAVVQNDVVRLGILPAGLEMHEALTIISDAFAASTTFSLGFLYTDGVDVTAIPQNAAYFGSSLAASSTGRIVATGVVAPVILPKDAYLVWTQTGADNSAAGIADILVTGIWRGLPTTYP